MTRENFEIFPNKRRRSYALRMFNNMKITTFIYGYVQCDVCNKKRAVHLHHIWFKSGCPVWYFFQWINLIPICIDCHDKVHKHGVKFEILEERKQLVIEDNKKYLTKN